LHYSFVKKTDIPKILNKYKLDLSYILDDKNFPLKETELLDICADWIDYSLREALIFREVSDLRARSIIYDLVIIDNKWVFKNIKYAQLFSKIFLKLNTKYYSGFQTAIMFRTVGDFLHHGLMKKYITFDDLYTTDKIVLAKIRKHLKKDKRLKLLWQRMNGKVEARQDKKNFDAEVFCKSRIVDPLFLNNGKIKRLSQADPKWSKIVIDESRPKRYFLKFEK
jgi:hypothetical protein